MRLLDANTQTLKQFHERPPYAIVSHRWGAESDEVLYTDINDPSRVRSKAMGHEKVLGACSMALYDGLAFLWLDTCCIDRRNKNELTTAINSMYKWYQKSTVCYVYLHDVNVISEITDSEWFLRGWTLQELIAPPSLKFFAKDWKFLCTREELTQQIADRTGIELRIFLSHGFIPHDVSIAQRMCWAARRETTLAEDMAYSLVGLFNGIHLPAVYGIGKEAFMELQYEIMSKSTDQSLFAWELGEDDSSLLPSTTGLLATSPSQFLNAYEIPYEQFYHLFGIDRRPISECVGVRSGALCVNLPIRKTEDPSVYEALLRCSLDPPQDSPHTQRPLVIYLRRDESHGLFARIHVPTSLRPLQDDSMISFTLKNVDVEQAFHFTPRNPSSRAQTLIPLPQNRDSGPAPTSPVVKSDERATFMHQPMQNEAPEGEAAPSSTPHTDTHTLLTQDSGVAPRPTVCAPERPWIGPFNNSGKIPTDRNTHFSTLFSRLFMRHPRRSKTINVIVCGEPGAGAGGVVNLILGSEDVDSQAEFKCAAMTFTVHDITLNSRNTRIFYAVGPRDHLLDVNGYHTAIENTAKLARVLREDGGVHLLLCCMLGTKLNRNIHRLFYETLCGKKVPTAVLITGLPDAENDLKVAMADTRYDDYAYITVVPPLPAEERGDYERSKKTVLNLIQQSAASSRAAYRPRDGGLMGPILEGFLSTSAKHAMTGERMRGSGSSVSPLTLRRRLGGFQYAR